MSAFCETFTKKMTLTNKALFSFLAVNEKPDTDDEEIDVAGSEEGETPCDSCGCVNGNHRPWCKKS